MALPMWAIRTSGPAACNTMAPRPHPDPMDRTAPATRRPTAPAALPTTRALPPRFTTVGRLPAEPTITPAAPMAALRPADITMAPQAVATPPAFIVAIDVLWAAT